MIHSLFNPVLTSAVSWALAHFLWQGTALALLLYVFVAFTRRPEIRYAAAVITLILMAIAPAVTIYVLRSRQQVDPEASQLHDVLSNLGAVVNAAAGLPVSAATHALSSIDWTEYCVWAWLAGVSVFGLRALGGYVVIQRLVRDRGESLSAELSARCCELQQKLGLAKPVKYVRSRLVEAPAVIGWLRPIVLLPLSALSNLSPAQLDAVILHELAHIKRLDYFLNLFQIAAETLLFYHPAVWWVSRLIRQERENCCDDLAVRLSGNAGDYARALVSMETWRAAPSLAVAATSGSLRNRVRRLLGCEVITGVPQSGLALIACLLIAGIILSAATVEKALVSEPEAPVTETQITAPPAPPPAPPRPVRPAAPPKTARKYHAVASVPPVPNVPDPPDPPDSDDDDRADSSAAGSSYIDELKSAGLTDMKVDDLIALKIQGVTPEYIQKVRSIWRNASIGEIIALKIQGVTPEYVQDLRTAGFKDLTLGQIIGAKIQGITPKFIRRVRDHGLTNLTFDQLIALKLTGVF